MMNSNSLKFAVSALALGSTLVACTPSATRIKSAGAAAPADAGEAGAAAAYAKAQALVAGGNLEAALGEAERAVGFSPRDVGYRMLLADLYLKNGRFASAETTFEDVLTLDPSNVRAGLSIALARIALGRTGGAIAQLDEMANAAPADLGLAYALAGEHRRAIDILEPAARTAGAHPRVRQNLALAYALSGDWQKARTTAAQDVSPDQLAQRLEHWARIAQPRQSWDQVAALLGVTPREDAGQPVHLALAPPAPAAEALAAVEAAPAQPEQLAAIGGPAPVPEPEAAPVALAAAPAAPEAPAWVSAASAEPAPTQPETAEETAPVYAAAVEALVTPQPAVMESSKPALAPVRTFDRPAPKAKPVAKPALAAPRTGTGRFAAQLGAFGSAAAVERAWASAYKRFGFAGRTPLSTTLKLSGGTFHRLSVAGFATHSEASRVCLQVRAKGGACFVRAVAGDAPVQWASRYTGRRA